MAQKTPKMQKQTKGKYKYFYLSMCTGIIFLAGMFYGAEFQIFTSKWWMSAMFTILPTFIFAFYLQEAYRTQSKSLIVKDVPKRTGERRMSLDGIHFLLGVFLVFLAGIELARGELIWEVIALSGAVFNFWAETL